MKDNKTVSNEFHELETLAKKYNLPVSQIMFAKEQVGNNLRDDIETYIETKLLPCNDALNNNKE